MTTNVSYALLDTAVISGRGEEPALGSMTHARLLEEVAALAGVLVHLGVGVGTPVVIDLDGDVDAVVAALATARIGGVVSTEERPDARVVIASVGTRHAADGRVRLLRGDHVEEPDLEWSVMLRAGRTDPAACEVLDPGAAYTAERTVAEQIAVLDAQAAPYDPVRLRSLLQV